MKEQDQLKFSDEGFWIKLNSDSIKVNWADVLEITAYKVDLLTVDEVRVDIITNAVTVTITEETLGYDVFKEKLKAIFPESDMQWEEKVVKPAFAENLTVIYKK